MNYSKLLFESITNKSKKKLTVDCHRLSVSAMHNRVLYWLVTRNGTQFSSSKAESLYRQIQEYGAKRLNNHAKTLELIDKISQSNDFEYILAKKTRTVEYVSSDIDLVVKEGDFESWVEKFESSGFLVSDHKEFLGNKIYQRTVEKQGYYKIDLTVKFCWQNSLYFDDEFVWEKYNSQTHQMNLSADFLINFATIIFKKYQIGILDYLYLKKLLQSDLNWENINYQTQKYGWDKVFIASLDFLNQLNPERQNFPVIFPLKLMAVIFKQKLSHSQFSINSFCYFVFARIRYLLNSQYLPGHVWWYPMEKFRILKNTHITL